MFPFTLNEPFTVLVARVVIPDTFRVVKEAVRAERREENHPVVEVALVTLELVPPILVPKNFVEVAWVRLNTVPVALVNENAVVVDWVNVPLVENNLEVVAKVENRLVPVAVRKLNVLEEVPLPNERPPLKVLRAVHVLATAIKP